MVESGLTIPQIRQLSPRQINTIYFHPRDKDGRIVPPEAPAQVRSYESGLAALSAMANAFKFPPEQIAEITRRMEELKNGNPSGTT